MSEVLKLVLTGMGTVFFILIMVVLLGNLIIRITNTFSPAIPVQASSNNGSSEIEPAKLAAIVSAVESVTRGKGMVTSVKKIDN